MSKNKQTTVRETDSSYFLKLVIYLVLGSLWLRISNASGSQQLPLPIGLMAGLLLNLQERLQFDRKIAYAVLLVAAFIGFWLPIGFTYVR